MRALSRLAFRQALGRTAAASRVRPPEVQTIPAPVGGLNQRDAWSEMAETDAIELDNWYPDFGKVTIRGGSRTHAELDTTDPVETVRELQTAADRFLIGAAGGALWDATAGGAIATPLGSGFASDRWQTANMLGALGLVNGQDAPQHFDGASLAAMTIAAKAGEPTLDVSTLIGINIFKSRSYFWAANSQDFWVSELNSLGGDLTLFPLGDVGSFGGFLVLMATWTRDGGAGPDDYAVFVMSSGEAIVYQGSDPTTADDWALVGVYRIGAPLGIRAWAKLDGDLLLVTSDGYSVLSRALASARGSARINVGDKIVGGALSAVQNGRDRFGWDVLLYPRGRRIMINHPAGGSYFQHVANLGTGAWCRFKGMEALCWTLFDDRPFFGAAGGAIKEADVGLTDDGASVVALAHQAFGYLGARGRNKQVDLVGPLLEGVGDLEVTLGLASDFNPRAEAETTLTLGAAAATGAEWDTAEWDLADWGASSKTVQAWLGLSARGYALSPSLRIAQAATHVSWNATRYAFRRVGVT